MQGGHAVDLMTKMKASINHQAKTTAEQIREQAAQDADRLKTRAVYQARMKIKDENKLKKKQIRSQKSVRLSIVNGSQRMKVLQIRDDAVNKAMEAAADKLKKFVTTPEYRSLLEKLCLQGLMNLSEPHVQIAVRAADRNLVPGLLGGLASAYKAKTGNEVRVELAEYVVPDACIGGCVLIAKEGRIQCSNTLMDRLSLSCKDLFPQIRKVLFGAA
jgi:V-type H+-transporting ATPase subunit E